MVNVRMCFLMVYLYRLFFRLQLEGLAMDFHCLICSFQVSLSLSDFIFIYQFQFCFFRFRAELSEAMHSSKGQFLHTIACQHPSRL